MTISRFAKGATFVLVAAALSATTLSPSPSAAAADTVDVGVLQSLTGTMAISEVTVKNATLLAIDEINQGGGVLGRQIEPVICDPASTPKQYRLLAERLLTVDQVRLIFGCYMSSSRKAVLPVVESLRGLLFFFIPNTHCSGMTPSSV